MNIYKNFAQIYDLFMADVDYKSWIKYLKQLWTKYNFNPKLITELGCGTGNITIELAKQGYDMIGIDMSEDMLAMAQKKSGALDILYLLQDMTNFELYGTVDCIISLCDSINYITDENDLLNVFKLVNNYLESRGLFIFDMNTEYKFKNLLSDNTFAQTDEDACYIWENFYDENKKINEYYMNFFVKTQNDYYERFEELHCQKAYTIEEIQNLLNKANLKLLNVFDAFTFDFPKDKSDRIYFIAQERTK